MRFLLVSMLVAASAMAQQPPLTIQDGQVIPRWSGSLQ